MPRREPRWFVALPLLMLLVASTIVVAKSLAADPGESEAAPKPAPQVAKAPVTAWVEVPLPIDGLVDTRTMQRIDRVVANLDESAGRPLLVVEFQTASGAGSDASQFERSLALARYLASAKLRRVRTVAFAPRGLQGHAILPALACEELVIGADAEFGPAGQDEGGVDATVLSGYQEIVERRRVFPWPVVRGMLDRDAVVSKVELADGVRYVLDDERRELEKAQTIRAITSVKPAGDLARFTGRDLRLKYGFASHLAADRSTLAIALGAPLTSAKATRGEEEGWKPLRVDVRGPVHARSINWIRRSLEEQLKEDQANLLVVTIDSPGGSLSDSLSLAFFLAELDASRIRTVAHVEGEARSDAALIALACDRLVMSADGVLGGQGTTDFSAQNVSEVHESLQQLAERKQIPWSLMAAMIDADVKLRRYTRQGTSQTLLMNEAEYELREDRELWQAGDPVDTFRGVRGRDAETLGLVEFLAEDFAGIRQQYQLTDDGRIIEPTWAHLFIERLASPRFAALLLFVAWFALMFEFMTPTITGAGFVSAVCFLLYFWSQFLHGTAGWLEVLLFVAGLTGVLLELFVLPGVGVFGFGGAILILVSIVLASQTFVIPRNQYQLEQLPRSLGVLIAGAMGAIVALAVLRHMIPRAPWLRRLMLPPPDARTVEDRERRETIVDFSHLLGKPGEAITQLTPAGKARVDGQVVNVVSEGTVIERGHAIEVIDVIGNRVVVRELA